MSEPDPKRIKLDDFRGDELPELVWLKIFDHFSFDERKPLKSLGKKYYALLNSSRYNKKTTLILDNCVVSPLCPPWTVLDNSNIKIRHIMIGKNVWMNRSSRLWRKIEETSEEITLKDESFNMQKFNQLILNFNSLKRINLQSFEQLCEIEFSKDLEEIHVEKSDIKKMTEMITKLKSKPRSSDNALEILQNLNKFISNKIYKGDKDDYILYKEHLKVVVKTPLQLQKPELKVEFFIEGSNFVKLYNANGIGPERLQEYPNYDSVYFKDTEDFDFLKNSETLNNIKEITLAVSEETMTHHNLIQNKFPKLDVVNLVSFESNPDAVLNHLPKSISTLSILSFTNSALHIDFPQLKELSLAIPFAFDIIKSGWFTKTPTLQALEVINPCFTFDQTSVNIFPGLQEIHLVAPMTVSQFQFIGKNWPQLKVLKAGFRCGKKELVEAIQPGDFKFLQVLDKPISKMKNTVDAQIDEHGMAAFDKVPLLRVFFDVTYKDYCLKKFKIIRAAKLK